jgi:2-polyprenyl-3-methyl-5-hydroxy-6-metoxy-1,4-benzoquinol methylase
MIQVKSPLDNNCNVIIEDEFLVETIIEKYKQDYDIDVAEYFEGLSYINVYKCLNTGYRFYFPLHLAGKDNLYEKLQKLFRYYEIRTEHKIAETFFRHDDIVLEIGCGNGFFLEKLQEKKISCLGLEFNQEAVKAGKSKGLNVLAEDIAKHSKENYERYDVVCSFQVLEHVVQVHDFIQAALDSLKVGGKFIVGVPNNNPYLYKYDKYHTLNLPPHHMGLWDVASLVSLGNVFKIKLDKILVEPLQEEDYDYFLNLRSQQDAEIQSKIFQKVLSNIKPSKISKKLQAIFNDFSQGRNILAVYTKI